MPVQPTSQPRNHRRHFVGIKGLYQKKQIRVYTSITLSVLTITFFSFFAIRPTLMTISGLLKETEDKKEVVTQIDRKISSLTQAQTNYNRIKPKIYLVEQSLPQEPALSALIKQIEFLAQSSSVNLDAFKVDKTNLQGELEKRESQEVGFSVALSGDYQNLKKFLNSLDTLRRVMLVKGFAFKSETEEGIESLVLAIQAKAYFLIGDQ
jgi:Tfp pilus assembly protein PilO